MISYNLIEHKFLTCIVHDFVVEIDVYVNVLFNKTHIVHNLCYHSKNIVLNTSIDKPLVFPIKAIYNTKRNTSMEFTFLPLKLIDGSINSVP